MQRKRIKFTELWERVLDTCIFEGAGEVMMAKMYVERIVKLGMSEEMASYFKSKMQQLVNQYTNGLPYSDPLESVR